MVAGCRVLLFISVFMLLVHNNQTQIAERQKYGRAYSQDNVIPAVRELLLPNLHPLGIRKLRMIDTETGSEYPLQTFGDLCRQGYLRQQIQHLLSLTDSFFYQMNINFRFSAGCNPMQQADILSLKTLRNIIVSPLLMLVQRI